ncbi:ankyrin repeat domain-containing protein [Fulvivirga ligni]|uniref:ankyrin repeat domain-containing protein n=1 Tax=Fulvivirga ligni TaxID=2904246 RepID=UPI001F29B766|nr:ankyrin repeat domain-containing protein [Fulvivirga ligni]UII24009.1 ankyrin repeat domain-containing protein [Fulvivirga ligni]
MKSIITTCLLFLTVSLGYGQENIFLQRSYWEKSPSLDEVKKIIEQGNDPAAFNAHKFNGIMYAMLSKLPAETVIYMLDNYSQDINELTHDGRNYLHWAAMGGSIELMKYLVERGVDVNMVDDHGYSVITFAATTGQADERIYNYLLANGANIKDVNHDGANSLLLLIPHLSDDQMIDYFIDHGLSLQDQDENGNNVFFYTAKTGNKDMMDILIEKGVDYKALGKKGANAIIAASQGTRRKTNDLNVFKYLESKGIAPNIITEEGVTPLHALAARSKDASVIEYFINKGVDINQVDNHGNTALINAASRNDLQIVKLVTIKEINHKNKAGETALANAVRGNTIEVVEFLIDKGAEVKLTDAEGKTLGYYLVNSFNGQNKKDFDSKLSLLKKHGFDPARSQAKGNSLLHLAVEKNDLSLVEKVLAMNIDVNQVNNEGTTALQIAAMKATDADILKLLVSKGANKKVKTDFDESVYDLASENEVLKENKIDLQFLK